MFRLSALLGTPLALLLLCPAAPAQTGADLVPEDAALAVTINSIARVRAKGEKFITDYDLTFPQESRPSALFDRLIKEGLGINTGLDEQGAAAVVVASLVKNKFDLFKSGDVPAYVVVPVGDADDIASNFGLQKGELKPGKVYPASNKPPLFSNLGRDCYVLLKDKHLYVGIDAKVLERIPGDKPVTATLSAEQKAAMTNADLALYVGAGEIGPLYQMGLDFLQRAMTRGDAADDSQTKELIDALRQARFLQGSLSLDDGGRITLTAAFNKGAARFLSSLRAGPDAADVVGLPAGAPWVVYGGKGDGLPNVARVRALVNLLFDRTAVGELLPGQERQKFLGSLEAMYRGLKASRAALYPTSDPKTLGQFGLVGIVDFADAEKHLAQWSSMVESLNAATQQAAGGKGKPAQYSYRPRAETLDGVRVDLLSVQMPDLARSDEVRLRDTFGPDWNKLRLAVVDNRIAFLLGSDVDLLKQTVGNLKAGKKGLAEEKVITREQARLAPERKLEFHFNLRNLWLYSQGKAPEPIRGMTSLALSVEEDRVQLEIVASPWEIKPFAAFLGLADDNLTFPTPEQEQAAAREFKEARDLLKAGDAVKARERLLGVVAKSPRTEAAAEARQELEKLDEALAEAELKAARDLLKRGDAEKAGERLLAVVTTFRGTRAAEEAWQELEKMGSDLAPRLWKLAQESLQAGNFERGEQQLQDIITKFPKSAAAEDARKTLAKLRGPQARDESTARAKLKLARSLIEGKILDKAKERLQEIVEYHPKTKAAQEAKTELEKLKK